MKKFIETLEKSSLFSGISKENIKEMLHCLHTRYAEYEKGEMVLWEGDKVNDIGIVLSGYGRSIKNDRSGKTTIVTLLETGSFIGVLLAVSRERSSPVSVQATEHLTVLFIPVENIIRRCAKACPSHDRLLSNVLDGIAEKALVLHDRNDCLIKSTVRDKILNYLERAEKEKGSKSFHITLDRSSMAEYLNVDRSALSRELSNMKKDGLIDYNKNYFIILS